MIINTKDLYLTATNDSYIIKVNNKEVLLQKRTDKSTCSYTKDNYRINQLIDEDFEYTVYCQEYISKINEVLEVYRDILTSSKVRLTK
jgi:acetylglutamate synthase